MQQKLKIRIQILQFMKHYSIAIKKVTPSVTFSGASILIL